MDKIRSIRGMHDILEQDFLMQQKIINEFTLLSSYFSFKPIKTPIMEFSEVFNRTLGNSSDVVMKEMYSFKDRNNESLTLRPEGTAGIARAVISNGLTQNLPLKFYYYGPMFRYERPQKGRLRQFNQIGIEMFSNSRINRDLEVISLAENLNKKLKINNNLNLNINNLGNIHDRNIYIKKLKNYYSSFKKTLSKDSLIRLQKNPLRILDSKDQADIEINKNAPTISEYLSSDSKTYFSKFKKNLKDLNISFFENPFLVRGLDYYNNTIFEFTLKDDPKFAILAGGSYDNLVSDLGGPELSGTGWAGGLERLVSLVKFNDQITRRILIVSLEDSFLSYAYKVRGLLLKSDFYTEIYDSSSFKKALKYANKINADYAVIIGEEEVKKNSFSIKNLKNGDQKLVNATLILEYFKSA
ncbi:MAG: histidine--tRNA ligase [Rickettsiales bacterium]|nr:histidine--tRNA ligase [Rickettsiales bacterium]OUV81431.1 MAG: histidine--tRNA ligase [Rickettsiales bacterium TMED131]